MNRWVLLGGLTATAALVAVLAAGFGKDTREVRSPLIGRAAPPFALERVNGTGTVSLESLKGKPAVVNFWATWCQPCMMEHHVLQEKARAVGSRIQFVGIVYEDEPQTITDFLARSGAAYPMLMDRGGRTAIAYGVYGVPETFFITAEGRIVHKYEGPLSPLELDYYLQQIERPVL